MAKEQEIRFKVPMTKELMPAAVEIPTKKLLIVFCVWNNETRNFSYDYTVKEFEIYDEKTDLKKLCENVAAFKEGYINGRIGKELYKIELNSFYEIDHLEV